MASITNRNNVFLVYLVSCFLTTEIYILKICRTSLPYFRVSSVVFALCLLIEKKIMTYCDPMVTYSHPKMTYSYPKVTQYELLWPKGNL